MTNPNFAAAQTNPFGLTDVLGATPTFVDIDGDGDLDAFVGGDEGDTFYFQNTGDANNPSFAAVQTNPFGLTYVVYYASPTFADIDGDGDLDAFVGAYDDDTSYFQNTGDANNPSFAAVQTNPFGLTRVGFSESPSLADIDGDGDLDAFVGEYDGDIFYFQNTGDANNPSFAAVQTNPFGLTNVSYYASPTFADIDGDGDLDAFVGGDEGDTFYFQNTGDANNPSFAAVQTNPFGLTNVGRESSPTFADIDGDGDLDAFVGSLSGITSFFKNGLVATDDSVTTDEDTTLSGDVFADNGNGADSDPDGDTFTVTEVNGNAANVGTEITLASGALLTLNANGTFDYNPNGATESDSFTYTINDGTETDTATVTVTINEVNEAPTDITLSSNTVEENVEVDTLVATLNTTDSDDTEFTYELVDGFGDNSAFTIDGSEIKINVSPDYETKSSYSIKLKTIDSAGNEFEKEFTINVTDLEEAIVIDEAERGTNKLLGGGLGDTLSGNDGRDYINGKAGEDVLNGGLDNDRVYGGEGNDTLDGGTGNDYLNGGTDNDLLSGGDGRDRLYGGEGEDYLSGGLENDYLKGEDGDDYLDGGDGKDRLFGGDGNDWIVGGFGNDRIDGGDGDDTIVGSISLMGMGFIEGDLGDNTLEGIEIEDSFIFNPLDLIGEDEINESNFYREVDRLKGGAGADIFVLGNELFGASYDDKNPFTSGKRDYALIEDFDLTEGDNIVLFGSEQSYYLERTRGGVGIFKYDDIFGEILDIETIDGEGIPTESFLIGDIEQPREFMGEGELIAVLRGANIDSMDSGFIFENGMDLA
ncbi:MAG: FG-GAP-like repeat-containing protein [Cyanobacteria bacterium P01_H01_bin.150]